MALALDSTNLFSMAKRPGRQIKRVWRKIYLKEWREYRHLTVERLAALAGVSPGLISQIENRISAGSPDTLERLAKALGISVGELLDVKPETGGFMMRAWVRDRDRRRVEDVIAALTKQPDDQND